jgi:DNA-binding MarR family transcriptional regulator
MVDQAFTLLGAIGDVLYAVFLMPGIYLLSAFVATAPVTALKLGITAGQTEGTLPVVVSLISWFVLMILLSIVWQVFRNWLRMVNAMLRKIGFRLTLATRACKTRLLLMLRWFLPRRKTQADLEPAAVEFDELDLAVLDSVSEQGPGFTLSAPELAEQLSLLPSKIQQSLEKLSRNKLLDSSIGSTDGFDNYYLTEAGATYVSIWQRQQSRG